MNIAFFFESDINPTKGGTERVTWSIAQYFLSQGINIYFIAHMQRPDFDVSMQKYHFFLPDPNGYDTPANRTYLNELLKREKIDILINQGAFSDEAKLCNKQVIDDNVKIISVIHYHLLGDFTYFSELLPPAFSGRSLRDKMMSFVRWIRMPILRKRAFANKRRALLFLEQNSDAIALLAEDYISDFIKITGAKREKLYAIPNPNTYKTIKQDTPKEKVVLYVGRLDYAPKRVDRLINAWKRIERSVPDWKLIIVGNGPDKKRLQSLSRTCQNIEFPGYTDPETYYQKAQVICLTSTHEGFGMVLTEAMQYRAVPIAFDSYQAVRDIIDDRKNGILIPPFDMNRYAFELKRLIQDNIWREELAQQTGPKVRTFELEVVGKLWVKMFNSIL